MQSMKLLLLKSSSGSSMFSFGLNGIIVVFTGATDTIATPWTSIPSSFAARHERSIMRPRPNGPLSVTLTMTDFPLAGFVTFNLVPKGWVRCAQVRLSWCSLSPLLVLAPVALLE